MPQRHNEINGLSFAIKTAYILFRNSRLREWEDEKVPGKHGLPEHGLRVTACESSDAEVHKTAGGPQGTR